MLTRDVFGGAFYGDALATGEQVILFRNSRFETHRGRVTFPTGDAVGVLYPVLAPDGLHFVGQGAGLDQGGQDGTFEWSWLDEQWHTYPPCNGVYGAAYDWQGVLHLVPPGPNARGNGWRYIGPDGHLVTGEETYGPKDGNGLNQWTDLGDGIQIGQANDDRIGGALVWDGTHHRRIDTGNIWPIRGSRRGDLVALSYTVSGLGVVIRRGTMADLRALPIADLPPELPPPPVRAPEITIVDYGPKRGVVPFDVTVQLARGGGPADVTSILLNDSIVDQTVVNDLTRRVHLAKPGTYQLNAHVSGPGGMNSTGALRLITVEEGKPVPAPPRGDHVVWQPNIASNMLALFKPGVDVLGNVGVMEFVAQHFTSASVVGPNTWPALLDARVFQQLHEQGIGISLGMSAVTENDPDGTWSLAELDRYYAQILADTGVTLGYVSIDVPMTKNKKWIHAPVEVLADRVARFIKRAHALGLKVAWDESWPEVPIDDQWKFLDLLDARADDDESLPNYFNMDIDHLRQVPDAHMIDVVNNIRTDFGISTAVMLAGYKHATDQEYEQDVLAWARQVKALGLPTQDRIFVGSWVEGFQQPNNWTHIALLNAVVELFA